MLGNSFTFRLPSGEPVAIRKGEFLRVTFYHWMWVFYFLLAAVIVVSNVTDKTASVPLELRLGFSFMVVLVGILALLAGAWVNLWMTRDRPTGPELHLGYVLLFSVPASVLFGEMLSPLLFAEPFPNLVGLALRIGFYVVTTEIFSIYAMYLLLPRAIARIRKEPRQTIKELTP